VERPAIDGWRPGRTVWTLTVLALCYSAVHFAQSGVVFPLRQDNIAKFEEEMPPLRNHLLTGEPVRVDNQVQYGPVFFFVVHPLLVHTGSAHAFSLWLYALQLACIGVAFVITCVTLQPMMPAGREALLIAWLTVLWLNFAPLYTILAVKSVETWELCLLSLGLFAFVRGRIWLMAVTVAAAALVKVLPALIFLYLLVTNRRGFVYACIAMAGWLTVSQILYGSDMGVWYWPKVVGSAVGDSYGLRWHENLSLKAAIGKMIGHLEIPTGPDKSGSNVILLPRQLRAATLIGDAAVLAGVALLIWSWWRVRERTAATIVWEWSLLSVAMLILSPNTTFEYATLVLGALSYAVVEISGSNVRARSRRRSWVALGGAMLLLGVLLPRQVLNRLMFVEALSRWSGYVHLTASEAYQYYCFPLAGLFLLAAAIWMLRPEEVGSRPTTAARRIATAAPA
jgi:hypothetical protein